MPVMRLAIAAGVFAIWASPPLTHTCTPAPPGGLGVPADMVHDSPIMTRPSAHDSPIPGRYVQRWFGCNGQNVAELCLDCSNKSIDAVPCVNESTKYFLL